MNKKRSVLTYDDVITFLGSLCEHAKQDGVSGRDVEQATVIYENEGIMRVSEMLNICLDAYKRYGLDAMDHPFTYIRNNRVYDIMGCGLKKSDDGYRFIYVI